MLKFVSLLMLCYVVNDALGYEITPEQKQGMKNIHDTCTEKTGASDSDIMDFKNGKHNPVDTLKCYMKCLIEMLGGTKDGVFSTEATMKNLPEEMKDHLKLVFSKCDTNGAVTCEFAYTLYTCAFNTDKEGLLLF